AFLGKGYTVGFLTQEPQLDANKTVLQNVQDGAADKMKVVNRWNEITAAFSEPMDDDAMQKLMDDQAKVQDQMDSLNLWDLDRQLEIAMDALRCPPGDADVSKLSGGERR